MTTCAPPNKLELDLDLLQYEITVKRVNHVLGTFGRYGEKIDFSFSPDYLSPRHLKSEITRVAQYTPVDGIELFAEIRDDLETFNAIVNGEFKVDYQPSKLKGRNYDVVSQQGHTFSALSLAYAGILTGRVIDTISERGRHLEKSHYSLEEIAKLSGLGNCSVRKYTDRDAMLLYGKYKLVPGKKKGIAISRQQLQFLLKDLDLVITLGDARELIGKASGKSKKIISDWFKRLLEKNVPIHHHDPMHTESFELNQTFGSVHAISLIAFDKIMNVVRRDKRVLNTHLPLNEAADLTPFSHNRLAARVESGALSATGTSIVGAVGHGKYVPRHEIDEMNEDLATLGLPDIQERLKRLGLMNCATGLGSYLHEKGYVSGSQRGKKILTPHDFENLIADLQRERRFSKLYGQFCSEKGYEIGSHLEEFQENFDVIEEKFKQKKHSNHQLRELLQRYEKDFAIAGVTKKLEVVSDFMQEHGFTNLAEEQGSYDSIVPQVIQAMQKAGHYSIPYQKYCTIREVKPEEAFDLFEVEFDSLEAIMDLYVSRAEKIDRRKSLVPVKEITQQLFDAGVLSTKKRLLPFLREHGFVDKRYTRVFVNPSSVPQIIDALRKNGRFSTEYIRFCKERGIKREEGIQAFEEHVQVVKAAAQ